MKYVIILLCLLSFAVFAQEPATGSGLGSFFSGVNTFFNDVMQFLTVETPSMMQRFWAWAIEWIIMIKLYLQYESIKFSWGVAKVILEDLSYGSQLNTLLAGLPNDVQAGMRLMRVTDCIEMLTTAHVTRFVMSLT